MSHLKYCLLTSVLSPIVLASVPALTCKSSMICSQKARRVRRKFGTYTLDGSGGKRRPSSISNADDDAPSQSEGIDTLKSSTDSYAVPQEKEWEIRCQTGLIDGTASPSAEAARTLLDLPDEPPRPSKFVANPEVSMVVGKSLPGETNKTDAFGNSMVIYETFPTKEGNRTEGGVVDGLPSTDTRDLGPSGMNCWAEAPVARLPYGDSNKPPLPASRMFSKRENGSHKPAIMAQPVATLKEDRDLIEEKLLSQPAQQVKSGQSDEEMDTKSLYLVHDAVQGVTGSSKSEGGPIGSKRRKGAVPRRVPQDQDGVQASFEDVKKEIGQGLEEYHTTADKASGKEMALLLAGLFRMSIMILSFFFLIVYQGKQ